MILQCGNFFNVFLLSYDTRSFSQVECFETAYLQHILSDDLGHQLYFVIILLDNNTNYVKHTFLFLGHLPHTIEYLRSALVAQEGAIGEKRCRSASYCLYNIGSLWTNVGYRLPLSDSQKKVRFPSWFSPESSTGPPELAPTVLVNKLKLYPINKCYYNLSEYLNIVQNILYKHIIVI